MRRSPVPSTLPNDPGEPASVLTTPAAVIFRIVLLNVSATYTVPVLSTATPCAKENCATSPGPSPLPQGESPSILPANLVTTPAGVLGNPAAVVNTSAGSETFAGASDAFLLRVRP